jgi:hypothetical protein
MNKGMFMIFKIFRKLKFYLDKAAYMQGVPQSGGPSIDQQFTSKSIENVSYGSTGDKIAEFAYFISFIFIQ